VPIPRLPRGRVFASHDEDDVSVPEIVCAPEIISIPEVVSGICWFHTPVTAGFLLIRESRETISVVDICSVNRPER